MMPPLLAEESMRATERIGVGTGAVPLDVARRITGRWDADLQTGRKAPARAQAPSVGALHQMGIGYTVVEK